LIQSLYVVNFSLFLGISHLWITGADERSQRQNRTFKRQATNLHSFLAEPSICLTIQKHGWASIEKK